MPASQRALEHVPGPLLCHVYHSTAAASFICSSWQETFTLSICSSQPRAPQAARSAARLPAAKGQAMWQRRPQPPISSPSCHSTRARTVWDPVTANYTWPCPAPCSPGVHWDLQALCDLLELVVLLQEAPGVAVHPALNHTFLDHYFGGFRHPAVGLTCHLPTTSIRLGG